MARMEIISGVERRRRWSKEAKLEILAEADQPGVRIVSAEFPAPVHRRGSEGVCVHNGDCGHNDIGWRGKIRAASSGSGSWQREATI